MKTGKNKSATKKPPHQNRAFLLQVQNANAIAQASVVMWMVAVKHGRELNTDGGRRDESGEERRMDGGGSLRGECRHVWPIRGRQWKPLPPSLHPHLFSIPSHHMHHIFFSLEYIISKLQSRRYCWSVHVYSAAFEKVLDHNILLPGILYQRIGFEGKSN